MKVTAAVKKVTREHYRRTCGTLLVVFKFDCSYFQNQNTKLFKEKAMSSSDEEDQIEVDRDTCSPTELINLFNNSLCLSYEESVSLDKDEYILYLNGSK